MNRPGIQPDLIHLTEVHILAASFETSDAYRENPVKPMEVYFGFGKQLAHNLEHGRTRIRLGVTMEGQDEKGVSLGVTCRYDLEFHFRVDNFQDFVVKDDQGNVKIHALLGATLLGIAFSTARGIIYERTRGTFLDGVILPVIDPHKLLMEEAGG